MTGGRLNEQESVCNACESRIHQPLQNPHNLSSWCLVTGTLQVDCLRLIFFGKNSEKVATTSILIPFAKFTFMYGGKNLPKVWQRFLRVAVLVWIRRHYEHNDYNVMYVS